MTAAAGKLAAKRLHEAAMAGREPKPADREAAREYVDERRIRHPLNRFLTLDERPAPREWDRPLPPLTDALR